MANPDLVLLKIDEMCVAVDSIRISTREMLETACKFHSAGGSTTQKLQKIEEYIKDHLKRLADMGKEVEVALRSNNMVPFMEEKMVQLYGALNNECSWKDIKDRTQLSVKQFEEQLRAQFPSAVAVRTNIPLTPVSSSPNNLAASLIAKRRRLDNSSEDIMMLDEEGTPSSSGAALTPLSTMPLTPKVVLSSSSQMLPNVAFPRYETFKDLDKVVEKLEATNAQTFVVSKILHKVTNAVIGIKIFSKDISFKPRSAIFSSDDTIPQDIMLMDKVAVYGVQEKKEGVWNRSQHNVFQKVSECARDALRYFSNNHPESAVKWMIMWLGTFRGLFSVPCRGCGKLLYHDSSKLMFLPPTYRTFDTGNVVQAHPYHVFCLPSTITQ